VSPLTNGPEAGGVIRPEGKVAASDGSHVTSGPGTAALVEALTGKGHQTIVPDHTDRIVMLLALA
jgi:hypothetical protein